MIIAFDLIQQRKTVFDLDDGLLGLDIGCSVVLGRWYDGIESLVVLKLRYCTRTYIGAVTGHQGPDSAPET